MTENLKLGLLLLAFLLLFGIVGSMEHDLLTQP